MVMRNSDSQPLCTHEVLLDRLPIGVAHVEGGILRYVNATFAEIHGFTESEMLGEHWFAFVMTAHHSVLRQGFSAATSNNAEWTGRIAAKQRPMADSWMLCTIRALSPDSYILTVQASTDGRHDGQSAITELRALRDATTTTNHGYWRWALETDTIETSWTFLEQLGYATEPEQTVYLMTTWFFDILHPDDQRIAEETFERYVSGQQRCWETDVRLRSSEGEWIRTAVRGCFVGWDQDGKPTVMAGTFTNTEKEYKARVAIDRLDRTLSVVADTLATNSSVEGAEETVMVLANLWLQRIAAGTGAVLAVRREQEGYAYRTIVRQIDNNVTVEMNVCWERFAPEVEHLVSQDTSVLRTTDPAYTILSSLLSIQPSTASLTIVPLRKGSECCGLFVAQVPTATVGYDKADPVCQLLSAVTTELISSRLTSVGSSGAALEKHDRSTSILPTQSLGAHSGSAAVEIVTGVSHELRQPLSAILSTTEALIGGVYGSMTAQQAVRMTEMHESAMHLLSLVNDLLDVSQAQHGTLSLDLKHSDVMSSVASAVTMMRPLADRKHIALQVAAPSSAPYVATMDEKRIRQVITNLVSNAIKFTPPWGEVRIELSDADNAQCVCVSVSDNGIGIAPELLPTLFEPFAQISRQNHSQGHGTGLGLSIVAHLVDAHGGIMRMSTTEGQGSTFSVCLPSSHVDAPSVRDVRLEGGSDTHGTVTVVDANTMFGRHVHSLLTAAGYRVDIAQRDVVDLQEVRITGSDLIILGVRRVDDRLRTGIRRIVSICEAHGRTPRIIVMPASSTTNDRQVLTADGVAHVLPKALAEHTLIQTVTDVLHRPTLSGVTDPAVNAEIGQVGKVSL